LKRTFRVQVAAATVAGLLSLLPLLFSCSAEQPENEAPDRGSEEARKGDSREARPGATGSRSTDETTTAVRRPDPRTSLVPVAHLSSLRESVSLEELSAAEGLSIPSGSLGAAEDLIDRPGFRSLDTAEAVVDHVSRSPGALGLLPWNEVEPRVKALGVEGESILEPGSSDPSDYPLRPGEGTGPDTEKLRRVVIGGDVVLDRGQNYMVIQQGMGLDFPMGGGYAAITGRTREPNPYSETGTVHQFTAVRTGQAGAVREYLSGADLTLANFENPVVESAVYHPEEATFTGDLRLMPILEDAGIDGVTLGNNHVLDAGTSGLAETLGHLDRAGIERAGAGMDLAQAREPMIFDLGGTRIGVLSHLSIPGYEWAWATETTPGTAPLVENVLREDVERLREEVDLVVVMPHWGMEYLAEPETGQVELAHAAVDAGADLVVGGHAHWPKGIEMYGGAPIFYGVGNFLLDQSWSEETSTGIFAEITLYGDRIVQVEPVPFVLLDYAQPNFLVREAGGNRALKKIYAASRGPEFEAYNDR
jgi:poly-gamma-glutamate capsule biosynthesis protein CapA/YwtB (metallophosphatase superfamily)